jgi:hypothetical protein
MRIFQKARLALLAPVISKNSVAGSHGTDGIIRLDVAPKCTACGKSDTWLYIARAYASSPRRGRQANLRGEVAMERCSPSESSVVRSFCVPGFPELSFAKSNSSFAANGGGRNLPKEGRTGRPAGGSQIK